MRFQKDRCFSRFFFEAIGAKKKLSKRNADWGVSTSAGGRSCKQLPVCFAYFEEGSAPPPRKLLKKFDQNFKLKIIL